jgi:bifunctional UDP-N-acetylglucosamine pyrophosphorylase/glucosamine-1-phosphate N-acetyltransferase
VSTGKKSRAIDRFSTIILAAGIGKRMHSKIPKIIHKILGKPIVSFVIDRVKAVGCSELIIVVGEHKDMIRNELGNTLAYALQPHPLGTGDAAKRGIAQAKHDRILIMNGDIPLIKSATIRSLIEHHEHEKADLTILTCMMNDPFGYGRIIRGEQNRVAGIIEQADATNSQKQIKEINVGVYFGDKKTIRAALEQIEAQNKQGELYLTDIIGKILERGRKVAGFKTDDEQEIFGINTREDLVRACRIVKEQWFDELKKRDIIIEDPSNTDIDLSVEIGRHVTIKPNTQLQGKTKIESSTVVGPGTWIKDGEQKR